MADTTWSFELRNRAGTSLGELAPSSVTLHRNLNRHSWIQATIPEGAIGADITTPGSTIVFAWERPIPDPPGGGEEIQALSSPTLRFAGAITLDDASGNADGGESVTINAVDALGGVEERPLTSAQVFSSQLPEDIIETLMTAENIAVHTGLDSVPAGVPTTTVRDRTYEAGKFVGEAIRELAEVDDGFFFVVTPLDVGGGVFGELDIRWPSSGVVRPGARFEYGEGTLGNIVNPRVLRRIGGQDAPTFIVAIGQLEGEPLVYAEASDNLSVGQVFGRWGQVLSRPDVSTQTTLQEHTREELVSGPVRTFTFGVTPHSDADGDVEPSTAPHLFIDFDVGDLVTVFMNGRLPQLQIPETLVRVNGASVTIDENGVGRLSRLEIEV